MEEKLSWLFELQLKQPTAEAMITSRQTKKISQKRRMIDYSTISWARGEGNSLALLYLALFLLF